MKNEVKLNIHLFFPEQQNDEISIEEHNALSELLALVENKDENSVEKFIAELKSRLALIKPLLGKKTEKFLGYCQEDIAKIENFFAGKYEKFGMDAVAVQKILRSVWLRTPCEDKLLNYDLYDFIDKEFYSIINRRKIGIDFNDIPAPVDNSWNTLKKDWMMRRKRYAEALEVDLEYLDAEAINGLEFPSASGLFANPSLDMPHCIEFLNYWMPHLNNKISNKKYFCKKHNKSKEDIGEKIAFSLPKYHNWNFSIEGLGSSWFQNYVNFFKVIEIPSSKFNSPHNKLYCSNKEEINDDNYMAILQFEKNQWYHKIRRDYYSSIGHPTDFFIPGKIRGYFAYRNNNYMIDDIYNPDDSQLPKFINSCNEFVMKYGIINYGKSLRFYNGEKFYLPRIQSYFGLVQCADAYDAAAIELPDVEKLQDVVTYYNNVWCKMSSFIPTLSFEILNSVFAKLKISDSEQDDVADHRANIFYYKGIKFVSLLKKIVDFYADDNKLSDLYKARVLATIQKKFSDSEFLKQELCPYIENRIKDLTENTGVTAQEAASFNLVDEINYFYKLQKQEDDRVEIEKAKTREAIFRQSCHTIGNLSRATNGNLDNAKDELESISPQLKEYQYVFNPLIEAKQDIAVILQYTTSITNSYRALEENWQDDFNKSDGKFFRDIVRQALNRSISHVFFRDVSAFFHDKVSENYFKTLKEMNNAQKTWNHLKCWNEQLGWITENLFDLTWEDNIFNKKDFKVSNAHFIETHLFTLFYEIFLNAVKAISYSPANCRYFSVKFIPTAHGLQVKMVNSIGEGNSNVAGGGLLIIDNYMKKFQIKDFDAAICLDKSCYETSFTLHFFNNTER